MRHLLGGLMLLLCVRALAHEDHESLPTKGATVRGDRLYLSPQAAGAVGLRTALVHVDAVRRVVHAVGTVELPWSQQAFACSLTSGRVESALVKPGERVAAGQVLARVAGPQLENLQLALLNAAADKNLAAKLLEGQQAARQGLAGKVLLQSRTELVQQTVRFHVAWQKLRALGISEADLQQLSATGQSFPSVSVVSPIDGVVAQADVRSGQIVEPAERLYHVVDASRVWIVGRLLEADASRVRRGLKVIARFPMLPQVHMTGQVDHVELRLNADRTLSVKVLLENPEQLLKPGMFARLEIELAEQKGVVCPREALFGDGAMRYALVEQSPGVYLRQRVSLAGVRGDQAQIVDGLFPGDPVVTVGSHELAALFAPQPDKAAAAPRAALRAPLPAQGQIELPVERKSFASAPIDGRIRRIRVEHGSQVRRGDVLAELESLAFTNLQLDYLQALSGHEQTTRDLQRAQDLGDAISRKDLWQLQAQHAAAQHLLASLRKQLSLVGLPESELSELDATDLAGRGEYVSGVVPILAAADGVVCEFALVPGQFVNQNEQLFEVHDPSRVWVRAFLFEQDAAGTRVGQAVEVRLAADPSFRASGRVDRMDPVLFSGNRALSLWTELDNPDLRLKEGMAASIFLDSVSATNTRK